MQYVSLDTKEKVKIKQEGGQDGEGEIQIANTWETDVECILEPTQGGRFQIDKTIFNIKYGQTHHVHISMDAVLNKQILSEAKKNKFKLTVKPRNVQDTEENGTPDNAQEYILGTNIKIGKCYFEEKGLKAEQEKHQKEETEVP